MRHLRRHFKTHTGEKSNSTELAHKEEHTVHLSWSQVHNVRLIWEPITLLALMMAIGLQQFHQMTTTRSKELTATVGNPYNAHNSTNKGSNMFIFSHLSAAILFTSGCPLSSSVSRAPSTDSTWSPLQGLQTFNILSVATLIIVHQHHSPFTNLGMKAEPVAEQGRGASCSFLL